MIPCPLHPQSQASPGAHRAAVSGTLPAASEQIGLQPRTRLVTVAPYYGATYYSAPLQPGSQLHCIPASPTAEHVPCAPQDTAPGPSQGLRSQRGPPHGGSHTQACLLAAEVAASYSAVGDQWRSHPRRCLWLPSGLTCHRVMRLWQVRGQCTCVTALVPHARVLAHVHASTEQPCGAGAVRTALDVLTRHHLVRVKVRARGNGRAKARVKLHAVVYP